MSDNWEVPFAELVNWYFDDITVGPDEWAEFSINGGVVEFRMGRIGRSPSMEFRTIFHPEGYCHNSRGGGEGVCHHCGRTMEV